MIRLRNFSWKYFTLTGDVESYMLYKEMDELGEADHPNALLGDDQQWASELEEASP